MTISDVQMMLYNYFLLKSGKKSIVQRQKELQVSDCISTTYLL